KPPFAGVDLGQPVAREQPRKELLRQVLGVLAGMTTAPNERVERIPIGLTQLFEGFPRLRRLPCTGEKNSRPSRCREHARARLGLEKSKARSGHSLRLFNREVRRQPLSQINSPL